MDGGFANIAILLAVAAAAGAIGLKLRQPLIVAFLLVGILVGPSALGWVTAVNEVHLLAQIGITVLLFVVGLKLDIGLVRNLGPVALATGLGQLGFTIVFGFALGLGLGMDWVKAVYIAVALTFSSTIIIVKLLSDKREIDSLHGRIAMGFLIVQDIAVVVAMMVVGSWTAEASTSVWTTAALIGSKLLLAAIVIGVLMRFVLPPLLQLLAQSQELLLVFALTWGILLAAVGEWAGFSREVGAFLAGFSLASTPFREAISTRLTSIRDFLLLFFFVDLGSRLDLATLGAETGSAIIFSVFVLVGNPLIVMAIMGYMGYRKRTGFLSGLTVAQISEFSIIFIAMGITLGHVTDDALGLVTMVGLVTITTSTYMILYSEALYVRVAPWLGLFERRQPQREMAYEADGAGREGAHVLVFGLGRYGGRLLEDLRGRGIPVAGIDFDPEVVRALRGRGADARFGDAEDPHLTSELPLARARWVVSTLPSVEANRALIGALRSHRYEGPISVSLHTDFEPDAEALRALGATHLFFPHRDAADFAAQTVIAGLESDTKPTPEPRLAAGAGSADFA
jgi:Kef-type K+ transport system membrane component KefB